MTGHGETPPPVPHGHISRLRMFKTILGVSVVLIIIGVMTAGINGGISVPIRLETIARSDNVNPLKLNKSLSSNYTFKDNSSAEDDVIRDVKKLRILCLIMTMEKDLNSKVSAVNKTWAKRCHRHFYVLTSKRQGHDLLALDVPDNRRSLVTKMRHAFQFVYDHHINDFDYVLKADDDTYVIIENLQLLMSNYPANEPGYLGFHFNKFVKTGYMSGGAGYVITNSGLRHLIERGYNKKLCPVIQRPEDNENSEDIETGRCLQYAGVPRLSSLDAEGRETFHPYTLHQHLFDSVPGYVFSWAKNKVGKGKDCCSRYSISFHYMAPDSILYTDHLLYDTSVFSVTDRKRSHKDIFRVGNVV